MTRVALLQIDVSDSESQSDREARVLKLIQDQTGECELAVLPELWNIGAFNYRDLESSAQPIDGELVAALKSAAQAANIWLHGGSFVERLPDGGMANTAVLIDPRGNLVEFYRKIHLYGFDKGEAVTMTRGTEVVNVADTPVGSTGLGICYDLRFPELFRKLSDSGIETILITSGWPTPRINHWRILLQARAIENQCWVIACNEVGPNGNVMLGGHSMVVSPRGEIVAEAGTSEEVLYADIDLAQVSEFRLEHPFQRDRFIR
jgi:predicted amidohydrolase